MTWIDYMRFAAALLFVLALMGGLSILLKRTNLVANNRATNKKRLQIMEILHLDSRRKAVLLRRDQYEHLVILGPNSETVIETNIVIPETDDKAQETANEHDKHDIEPI